MVSSRVLQNLQSELRGSLLAKLGIVIIVFMLMMAVFAPLIAPHDPRTQNLQEANLPPIGFSTTVEETSPEYTNGSVTMTDETVTYSATWEHPLGTDALGRDMLSRVIYGARTSLLVGILGVVIAMLTGIPVGLIAGYYGGRIDDALMRGADIMLAFPALVLAIALAGLFGQASVSVPDPLVTMGIATNMPRAVVLPGTVIIVVGLVNWVWFARVARGEALTITNEEYVKAARSIGASNSFIMRKHLLPNSITPILVLATIQIATVILIESALSFLGFSGTTLSWGFDIAQGRQYLATSWWIATIPGLAISLTVIGINLVGDWLRDALDPGIGGEAGGGGA